MNTYVSPDLTHFVGRGRAPEAQYQLLLKILREGWLTHPPHRPGPTGGNLSWKRGGRISLDDLYRTEIVCFCDIPASMRRIHMRKYSEFGISFTKKFLVSKGASPVFYVARNSMVKLDGQSQATRADYFDERVALYQRLSAELDERVESCQRLAEESEQDDLMQTQLSDGNNLVGSILNLQHLIDFHLLSFIKFFDPSYLDEDEQNYYMEREWRVFGNIQFAQTDVAGLTVPRAYHTKLQDELPDYSGKVFVAEDAK